MKKSVGTFFKKILIDPCITARHVLKNKILRDIEFQLPSIDERWVENQETES